MLDLRRPLFLAGLTCAGVLTACNDRGQMGDTGPRTTGTTFLGPIPAAFRDTVDAGALKDRLAQATGRLGLADGGWLTDEAPAPAPAPAPASDDVLPELAGCHALRSTMGGFLTRRRLQNAAPPTLSSLVGQGCDAALAAVGLTFADLERALRSQTAALSGAALTPDSCTAKTSPLAPSPRAAVAESYERADTPRGEMSLTAWPLFFATLEGGADQGHVALRSELNSRAVEPGLDGHAHLYKQWTAVATLVDEAAQRATVEKSESVQLASADHPDAPPEASLERHSTVTLSGGDAAGVQEQAVYVSTLTHPTPVTRRWLVTLAATPGPRGALEATLGLAGDGLQTQTATLELAPGDDGRCVVKQR